VSDRRDHAERQCGAIDENICAGCGSCASTYPTGAASSRERDAGRRLRAPLQTYRKAGGPGVSCFSRRRARRDIITPSRGSARGLPANVLPLRVNG
jgi:ferredoxin